jgi:predicted metal-dependent phosphoesterase TrpH
MDHPPRVDFRKPDLYTLTRRYTVVDMHFHTRYSDGTNGVRTIAANARRLGIGIAVTDHNAVQGALEIARFKGLLTIPGIEVTSVEGTHLLVYFYQEKDLRAFFIENVRPFMGPDVMSSTSLEMEQLVRRARRFHCLIIFPHPFSAAYTGIQNTYFSDERRQALFRLVDGVEALNAENMNKWNLQCTVLGFNLNKAMTGGSDGHRITQMGRAVTYAACPRRRDAFLDAIKQGEGWVVGKEINLLRKMTSNTIKLSTSFRNYPNLMEKNIRYSYSLFNAKSRTLRNTVVRRFQERLHRNG